LRVVMLQQIWNFLELGADPGEVERVGSQPGEHADIALRRPGPLLVVHGGRQVAPSCQSANAALYRIPRGIALQNLESDAKADLVVRWLKPGGVANACNRHASDDDRVIDDLREKCVVTGRRENARGEDDARGALRTREREQIGEVGRGLTNRPRTINVIGHLWPPSSD